MSSSEHTILLKKGTKIARALCRCCRVTSTETHELCTEGIAGVDKS